MRGTRKRKPFSQVDRNRVRRSAFSSNSSVLSQGSDSTGTTASSYGDDGLFDFLTNDSKKLKADNNHERATQTTASTQDEQQRFQSRSTSFAGMIDSSTKTPKISNLSLGQLPSNVLQRPPRAQSKRRDETTATGQSRATQVNGGKQSNISQHQKEPGMFAKFDRLQYSKSRDPSQATLSNIATMPTAAVQQRIQNKRKNAAFTSASPRFSQRKSSLETIVEEDPLALSDPFGSDSKERPADKTSTLQDKKPSPLGVPPNSPKTTTGAPSRTPREKQIRRIALPIGINTIDGELQSKSPSNVTSQERAEPPLKSKTLTSVALESTTVDNASQPSPESLQTPFAPQEFEIEDMDIAINDNSLGSSTSSSPAGGENPTERDTSNANTRAFPNPDVTGFKEFVQSDGCKNSPDKSKHTKNETRPSPGMGFPNLQHKLRLPLQSPRTPISVSRRGKSLDSLLLSSFSRSPQVPGSASVRRDPLPRSRSSPLRNLDAELRGSFQAQKDNAMSGHAGRESSAASGVLKARFKEPPGKASEDLDKHKRKSSSNRRARKSAQEISDKKRESKQTRGQEPPARSSRTPIVPDAATKPFSDAALKVLRESPPDNASIMRAMLGSDSNHSSEVEGLEVKIQTLYNDESSSASELTAGTADAVLHGHRAKDVNRATETVGEASASKKSNGGSRNRNSSDQDKGAVVGPPGPSFTALSSRRRETPPTGPFFETETQEKKVLFGSSLAQDSGPSPEMWTAEMAGQVNYAPIFQLPDGRVYRHPPMPPGWKLAVSRSKNRPYYFHPDIGSTFFPPILLPFGNESGAVAGVPNQHRLSLDTFSISQQSHRTSPSSKRNAASPPTMKDIPSSAFLVSVARGDNGYHRLETPMYLPIVNTDPMFSAAMQPTSSLQAALARDTMGRQEPAGENVPTTAEHPKNLSPAEASELLVASKCARIREAQTSVVQKSSKQRLYDTPPDIEQKGEAHGSKSKLPPSNESGLETKQPKRKQEGVLSRKNLSDGNDEKSAAPAEKEVLRRKGEDDDDESHVSFAPNDDGEIIEEKVAHHSRNVTRTPAPLPAPLDESSQSDQFSLGNQGFLSDSCQRRTDKYQKSPGHNALSKSMKDFDEDDKVDDDHSRTNPGVPSSIDVDDSFTMEEGDFGDSPVDDGSVTSSLAPSPAESRSLESAKRVQKTPGHHVDVLGRPDFLSSRFEPKTRPMDDGISASDTVSHVSGTNRSITSWQSRTSSLGSALTLGSTRARNPPMQLCSLQNLDALPLLKRSKKNAPKKASQSRKAPPKRKSTAKKKKQAKASRPSKSVFYDSTPSP